MVYLIRSVLKSGMQARSGAAYTKLEQAILAAGEQLKKVTWSTRWI
jgi:hypothetical protein